MASRGPLETEFQGMARPEGRTGVVVAAAGVSRRMEGVDKVFAPLLGRPLILHTLEVFCTHPWIDEVVLVLAPESVERGLRLLQEAGWPQVRVCPGGLRRQDSVARGLELVSQCRWVMVHDGARPCLEPGLITEGLKAVRETGAAVAAVPVVDTVKRVSSSGLVLETPSREGFWWVQTPQVFRRDLLAQAHCQVTDDVTDDAMMVERLGCPVGVFPGLSRNIKVTTPEDLVLAEAILRARRAKGP